MTAAFIAGAVALAALITWGVLKSRSVARDIDRCFSQDIEEEED